MALSKEDMASIAAMIAQASQPEQVKSEPVKATTTATKAQVIKRNLDPIAVEVDESVSFEVIAANGGGPLTKGGARVVPYRDGKQQRSFDLIALNAIVSDGVVEQLRDAIDTINRRAKLAEHAVKVEATS